jgi:hypothetical protein
MKATQTEFPPADLLARILRDDVEKICLPHGRRVGTQGHDLAEAYLHERMTEIGCLPYRGDSIRSPYESEKQSFVNLIGRIPGRDGSGRAPLLIGAHYDSVIDAPCADDNAAAVAIAIAVGHAAAQSKALERDLIVAIFDSEEPPYFQGSSMGSNYFARHQMLDEGMHGVIVMDLVGHDVPGFPGFSDLVFVTGAESHPELKDVFNRAKHPETLKVVPTLNSYVGDMSDHGAFRKLGIPYFFLSCGHWEHYHRTTDTPDRLNYQKMAAISELNFGFLKSMDLRRLEGNQKQECLCDTTEFEIHSMRNAFGPALPALLRNAQIKDLLTREDVTRLVRSLQSGFGL